MMVKLFALMAIFYIACGQEYRCHYLGNRKTLEYTKFDDFNKLSLTLTVPVQNGWFGVSFLSNNAFDTAMTFLVKNDIVYQAEGHNKSLTLEYTRILDANANFVDSLFGLGPQFQTLNLFMTPDTLKSQTQVYYTESGIVDAGNLTVTPVHGDVERYNHSILFTRQIQDCTNFLVPLRAEIYHYAAFGVILAVYAVLLVLCILFGQQQPLKSRGLSPALTTIFLFIQLLLEVRNAFPIAPAQPSLCLYYAYAIYPLMEIIFAMNLLYFLRYFIVMNMKNSQNLYYERIVAGELVHTDSLFVKLLKVTSTLWFSFIVLAIFISVIYTFYTIVLASTVYVCQFSTLIAIKSIHQIILVFIYSCTLLLFVVDLLQNFRLIIGLRWAKYILLNDPNYFRLQILLFCPYMIYNIASEAFIFFNTFDFPGVFNYFTYSLIFNTITMHLLLVLGVVFPLIITIFKFIIRLFRKKAKNEIIQDLVRDPAAQKLFMEFCKQEWSLENFLCYIDLMEYKRGVKDPQEVYDRFFNGELSTMEVNVNRGICLTILEKIKSGVKEPSLFDPLEQTVLTNLGDSYSRFSQTTKYLRLQREKKIQKELLDVKK